MSLSKCILRGTGALLLASFSACRQQSEATREPSSPPAAPSLGTSPPTAVERVNGYPPGRWRLLSSEELGSTMLWLSDIVIRHSGVNFPNVSYHYNGWLTANPLSTRTPSEALALAEEIVRRARGGADFRALAREYSDEPETSSRGGSLGGVIARHLAPWPQVLDALETLGPGEVSGVVETDTGYHVLLRRSPPPEIVVSGRHLVIAHDSAPWFALAARGAVPQRSREEALAIARDLHRRAQARPSELKRLIGEHSEHRDAVRGGDFGAWSTREPTELPREVETLAGLEVGEVAEPIDSLWGIQIIQRTENTPRKRFAMAALELSFDPSRPDAEPASRRSAQGRIEALSAILRRHPERFDELREQHCCSDVREVIAGRYPPAVEHALARLAPGQLSPEPLEELNLRFSIVRRLPLTALPKAPPTRYELAAAAPGAPRASRSSAN